MDKIHNKVDTDITLVSSGSLAEGLDLPGSDQDVMIIINSVEVTQNVQHMNCSVRSISIVLLVLARNASENSKLYLNSHLCQTNKDHVRSFLNEKK
jgi:hypothetical protein